MYFDDVYSCFVSSFTSKQDYSFKNNEQECSILQSRTPNRNDLTNNKSNYETFDINALTILSIQDIHEEMIFIISIL